jgi:hypothetical protein
MSDEIFYIINDQHGIPGLFSEKELQDKVPKMYNKLQVLRKWNKVTNYSDMLSELFKWTKDSTDAINNGKYSFINENYSDETK